MGVLFFDSSEPPFQSKRHTALERKQDSPDKDGPKQRLQERSQYQADGDYRCNCYDNYQIVHGSFERRLVATSQIVPQVVEALGRPPKARTWFGRRTHDDVRGGYLLMGADPIEFVRKLNAISSSSTEQHSHAFACFSFRLNAEFVAKSFD